MSCTLYWKKVVKEGESIGNHILRDRLENRFGLPCILNRKYIDYLQGLADGNIDGADELIELIEHHGEIEMYKEC